jgi:hypothetical protein
LIYQGRFGPAFWTVTGTISLIVNAILIAVLLGVAGQLFELKALLSNQLVGGLYDNFVLMDQARIQAVIPVKTSVRADFTIPVHIESTARLGADTYIGNARIANLSTGGMTISNAPVDIVLPEGTELPIVLDIEVPVDEKIPVNLKVDVDIPLNNTDLHRPFVGLQQVIGPYYSLLDSLPNSWQQALCGSKPDALCKLLIP